MPRVVDCVQPEFADLNHLGVIEKHVIADVREHRRVEFGDGDFVAGLAHCWDGLDVVPVAVGFEHSLHTKCVAEFEELFVFVGCIE